MISAVLDVNVFIAAMLSARGAPREILTAWQAQQFQLLVSDGIIAEVAEKLSDKKIGGRYGVTTQDIGWVRGLLLTQAQAVAVLLQDIVSVTGDPEDDYLLATARLAHANYLVTGDSELLALQQHEDTMIVTPRAFLDILGENAT